MVVNHQKKHPPLCYRPLVCFGLSSMKPIIDASVLKLADMILINGSVFDGFEDILHVGIPFRIGVGV